MVPLPSLMMRHIGFARPGSPQHRFNASEQFAGGERFDDIIVGAHFQPAHAIFLRSAGSQNDDRPGRTDFADFGQHFQTIAARQQQIKQDEIDVGLNGHLQADGAVSRLRDFVTGQPQRVNDAAANGRLIFDHDDTSLRHG